MSRPPVALLAREWWAGAVSSAGGPARREEDVSAEYESSPPTWTHLHRHAGQQRVVNVRIDDEALIA